ncbi:MAG TPA: ATP-binding protein, partial [Candidatus Norongarragalinales archaeon]|nr:ATP-binding protein [Candidatus Norongarragalinales archaeon]
KDEFGEGWVLKAGAMVLASGGQVNIDEVDKMDENDRVAMHEALESGQISIAKAGIVTTFKARTAVLAAANPKLGRFNPNEPPASQFDIGPTLQSRFDLIFPIKDVLDESRDRKMAEHILKGHKYASDLSTAPDSAIVPPVPVDLLRKYIAYARKNYSPTLSEDASEKIKEFYLRLRKLGEKQNNYPVTARQIEGLIRLSEASAKARLSGVVELQDADRAINLTDFVLQTVFMDRETGRIDSDIINIGQAKSRTDRARTILSIIEEKEKAVDMVAIEDVVKEAEKVGIDEPSARRIIEDLHKQTEIYRPKSGFVRTSKSRRQ